MSRTSHAGLLAALTACLLAAMLLVTPPASAGVATVYQCRTPTGVADTDLVQVPAGPSGLVLNLDRCAADGASILDSGGAGANSAAGDLKMSFAAPGSTSFVGGTLTRQMYNYAFVTSADQQSDSWAFGYSLSNSRNEILEQCAHSGGNPALGSCSPAFTTFVPGAYSVLAADSKVLPTAATASYTLTVGCVITGRCYHHYENPGVNRIAAALKVADDAAPSDVHVGGPLATADPVGPADLTLDASASDVGGLGVYRAELLVDDVIVDGGVFSSNGGKCADVTPGNDDPYEFSSGHPCPQVAPTRTLQARQPPEGVHNLKVRIEDAAGNRVVALDRRVTIDLVPAPSSTGAPRISGTPTQGRTLVADPGTWNTHGGPDVSFSYRWQRCDAAGGACEDIPGATSSLFDLGPADAGRRVRIVVTAANTEGAAGAISDMTPVIAGSAAPGDSTAGGGNPGGLPGVQDTLGPDLRPLGAPNGLNAGERVVLSAYESTSERRHVRVRYGRAVTISGRLLAPGGLAVSGARVEVLSQERRAGAAMTHQVDVPTDADGRFRYIAPAGPSRVIRLGYRARVGDVTFARTTDVDVRVVASVALRLSRKRLHNGETLRYLGRLRGPGTGHRFVEVQVRNGRSWQIVCSVRTDARGAFACGHRFRRTYRLTTYAFRARVRRQPGLAYEAGTSPMRRARVRP